MSSFTMSELPVLGKYCDISSVTETCRENLRLQQEKDDLKSSFIQSEFTRRYLEYLSQDRCQWPSVKQTEEKLSGATQGRQTVKEALEKLSGATQGRQTVKEALEEEKENIRDTLDTISNEYHNLQQKKKTLDQKLKTFEEKKAMFETKLKIKPDTAAAAMDKCQQAIGRLEKEIANRGSELLTLERSISDLQAQQRSQRLSQGSCSAEQMLQRASKVLTSLESLTGVTVGDMSGDAIVLHFTRPGQGEETRPTQTDTETISLALTVSLQLRPDQGLQLTGVKSSVDGFKIEDIVDVAIATNDLPYLIGSVQDRWIHHFPLLSEIDILNKNHAIDWMEEQSRLRVLVGKCGRVMFTLSVPKDYPTSRKITLLDSYGVDDVDETELPEETATLLQWVTFLETRYADCE